MKKESKYKKSNLTKMPKIAKIATKNLNMPIISRYKSESNHRICFSCTHLLSVNQLEMKSLELMVWIGGGPERGASQPLRFCVCIYIYI